MFADLSLVYYTANSVPDFFASNVRQALAETTQGRFPIVCVSQKPVRFGDESICVGELGLSVWNLYRQVLIGCEHANTEYVAMCEDDALYTLEHFTCFRPEEFGCNRNRWNIRTWDTVPKFSHRNRSVFSQYIAKRSILISALSERLMLEHDPNRIKWIHKYLGEPGRYDEILGVTIRKVEEFRTTGHPNIVFDHLSGLQSRYLAVRKRLGHQICDELPGWGQANQLLSKYFGVEEWSRQQNLATIPMLQPS